MILPLEQLMDLDEEAARELQVNTYQNVLIRRTHFFRDERAGTDLKSFVVLSLITIST